jgi:uncharacterized protein YbjQ (UPF0145 family)
VTPDAGAPAAPGSAGGSAAARTPAGGRAAPNSAGSSRLTDSGGLADQAIAVLASPLGKAGGSRSGAERSVFSSDLSVDEAILLSETGWAPRRLVMGSSIYHVGYVMPSGGFGMRGSGVQGSELTALTQAMYDARHLAMGRLVSDARTAGCEAVVGVRLTVGLHHSERNLAEFTAIGTGIAHPDHAQHAERAAHKRGAQPDWFITTDLSGQDFYLLDRAGYEPLGLVVGNCVYYSPPNWASLSTTNVELESPTQALTRARELAMGRLQEEAMRLGASGVVGVHVSEHAHAWWRNSIEFLAIGTAVRLKGGAGSGRHIDVEVRPVVELHDAVIASNPGAVVGTQAGGEAGGE